MKMSESKLIIDEIKKRFITQQSFTFKEIFNFYKNYEPEIKESNVLWKVNQLKKKKIIFSIRKGTYTLAKNSYSFMITNKITTLYNQLKKKFPYLKICIWDSRFLNNFMIHQLGSN
jgi:hypothetical protein